ncbi:hypothetical protein N9J72_02070 [Candidatus Gracilibacteria bacterium]|nr:hypothetical protein [Candidatus Gracilibacteria bacterium]
MTYSKDFETTVLQKLGSIESDVSTLKSDVSTLKTDVEVLKHKTSELDEKMFGMNIKMDGMQRDIDEGFTEVKGEIRQQGKYLGQAFNYITDMKMGEMSRET